MRCAPGPHLPFPILVLFLFSIPLLLVAALPGRAEAGADPGAEAVERGRLLFHDTQELMYPSCALCHSLLPEVEERKKAKHLGPGSTLFGAAVRQGWRNLNTYADVGEASQLCARVYQERKRGLSTKQRGDLVAFLRTQTPQGPLPRRKVQKKPKLLKTLEGGDPARGERLTERHCRACHHDGEDAISFHLKPRSKKRDLIARKVRGYDSRRKFKPGAMSYFTTDRLPDADLKHILAHLGR
jgi:mono/diheme cytochrome c family protein